MSKTTGHASIDGALAWAVLAVFFSVARKLKNVVYHKRDKLIEFFPFPTICFDIAQLNFPSAYALRSNENAARTNEEVHTGQI